MYSSMLRGVFISGLKTSRFSQSAGRREVEPREDAFSDARSWYIRTCSRVLNQSDRAIAVAGPGVNLSQSLQDKRAIINIS